MPSVPVGKFIQKAGRLVLEVMYPTRQELNEKPELAIGVLLCAIWQRCFKITRSGEGAKPPEELFKVLWDLWIRRLALSWRYSRIICGT
jgi:hypothetical protein